MKFGSLSILKCPTLYISKDLSQPTQTWNHSYIRQ